MHRISEYVDGDTSHMDQEDVIVHAPWRRGHANTLIPCGEPYVNCKYGKKGQKASAVDGVGAKAQEAMYWPVFPWLWTPLKVTGEYSPNFFLCQCFQRCM